MVLKQLDLLLAAYNKTVPVSRFETPTPANMNRQQLSQSTHGSSTDTLSSAHFLAQYILYTRLTHRYFYQLLCDYDVMTVMLGSGITRATPCT